MPVSQCSHLLLFLCLPCFSCVLSCCAPSKERGGSFPMSQYRRKKTSTAASNEAPPAALPKSRLKIHHAFDVQTPRPPSRTHVPPFKLDARRPRSPRRWGFGGSKSKEAVTRAAAARSATEGLVGPDAGDDELQGLSISDFMTENMSSLLRRWVMVSRLSFCGARGWCFCGPRVDLDVAA